tara:strand:+ start:214 stop:801 length:588 start_codon:yes stop_codon:yes gene_type:complete
MFTGIITDLGQLAKLEKWGDLRATVRTGYDISTIEIGASIACNGVCLTVIALGQDSFDVEISAETVSKTNASTWVSGSRINLERSLKLGDELGGHIVSGHVDGVALVTLVAEEGDSTRVVLEAPDALARFVAPKGSVALNGTSLTVNEVDGKLFGINFIPHTKKVTTWGDVVVGDLVNIEIDTLARYVARLRDFD